MQNFVNAGNTIEYTATAALLGGEIVSLGGIVGIAQTSLAVGETGALAVTGVYDLPKGTGAVTQGAKVYMATGGKVSATEAAQLVGVAWQTVADSATTVRVKINF